MNFLFEKISHKVIGWKTLFREKNMGILINLIFGEHHPQRKTYIYIFSWYSGNRSRPYTIQKVISIG